MSARGASADKGKAERAVNWIIAALINAEAKNKGSGVDGRDLRTQAKVDGAFSSASPRGTGPTR